jgi:hypothetical protein
MQVTQEDGGRLNAFAREPRMVVMEKGEANGPSGRRHQLRRGSADPLRRSP